MYSCDIPLLHAHDVFNIVKHRYIHYLPVALLVNDMGTPCAIRLAILASDVHASFNEKKGDVHKINNISILAQNTTYMINGHTYVPILDVPVKKALKMADLHPSIFEAAKLMFEKEFKGTKCFLKFFRNTALPRVNAKTLQVMGDNTPTIARGAAMKKSNGGLSYFASETGYYLAINAIGEVIPVSPTIKTVQDGIVRLPLPVYPWDSYTNTGVRFTIPESEFSNSEGLSSVIRMLSPDGASWISNSAVAVLCMGHSANTASKYYLQAANKIAISEWGIDYVEDADVTVSINTPVFRIAATTLKCYGNVISCKRLEFDFVKGGIVLDNSDDNRVNDIVISLRLDADAAINLVNFNNCNITIIDNTGDPILNAGNKLKCSVQLTRCNNVRLTFTPHKSLYNIYLQADSCRNVSITSSGKTKVFSVLNASFEFDNCYEVPSSSYAPAPIGSMGVLPIALVLGSDNKPYAVRIVPLAKANGALIVSPFSFLYTNGGIYLPYFDIPLRSFADMLNAFPEARLQFDLGVLNNHTAMAYDKYKQRFLFKGASLPCIDNNGNCLDNKVVSLSGVHYLCRGMSFVVLPSGECICNPHRSEVRLKNGVLASVCCNLTSNDVMELRVDTLSNDVNPLDTIAELAGYSRPLDVRDKVHFDSIAKLAQYSGILLGDEPVTVPSGVVFHDSRTVQKKCEFFASSFLYYLRLDYKNLINITLNYVYLLQLAKSMTSQRVLNINSHYCSIRNHCLFCMDATSRNPQVLNINSEYSDIDAKLFTDVLFLNIQGISSYICLEPMRQHVTVRLNLRCVLNSTVVIKHIENVYIDLSYPQDDTILSRSVVNMRQAKSSISLQFEDVGNITIIDFDGVLHTLTCSAGNVLCLKFSGKNTQLRRCINE